MEETLPMPQKRQKLCAVQQQPIAIKAVLPDEYEKPIELEPVFISQISEKRHISAIMAELSRKLPIPTLQHLKRVRHNDIIVCSTKVASNAVALKQLLEELQLTLPLLELLCKNVQIIKVPATATKLRWQYEVMQQHWPCKFHPDKYLESLYNGSNFSQEQQAFHAKIVKLLLKLAASAPAAACIDPRTNSIVALAVSKTHLHPMMHAPMLLIDFVARTQAGGAWNASVQEQFLEEINIYDKCKHKTLTGIPKSLHKLLLEDVELKDISCGAERLLHASEEKHMTTTATADNLAKYGPYLCTGYDIDLSQEPCLMCAMALVHSRAKRIFFIRTSKNGTIVSQFKLHGVKELNHHYEVYQCFIAS